MKRIVIAALATCILTFSLSCKKGFLDQVPDDRLTLDETFRNRNSAEKFLANVYSVIPDEASQRFPGSDNNIGEWTGGSDEAEYDWGFVATQNINNGTYDASSGFVSGFWTTYYRGIRSAGIFIDNVDKVSDLPNSLKVQYRAEARALRAMYYFWLMRIYGPVVIIGDKTISPDASFDDVQLPRSSFDECVAYVTSELDAAMADLPLKASNTNNFGRINSNGY
jgi:hypothetical protein